MGSDGCVEHLTGLGLTVLEAEIYVYLLKHSPEVPRGPTDKRDLARLMDEAEYEAKKAQQARLAQKDGPTTRPAGADSIALSMSAGDKVSAVALGKLSNSRLPRSKPPSPPGAKNK